MSEWCLLLGINTTMPRREKLRAVNKQVVSEKAATSKDSTDENRSESNNGGIIDFAAKKRRKAKPSKLDKQKKRKVSKSDREIDGDSSGDDGSDDGDSGKITTLKSLLLSNNSLIYDPKSLGLFDEHSDFIWFVAKSKREDLKAFSFHYNELSGNASGEHSF